MLKKVSIKNFKSLKSVQFDISSSQVIIGKNGCGKTSLFESIYFVAQLIQGMHISETLNPVWQGRDLVWNGADDLVSFCLEFTFDSYHHRYEFSCKFEENSRTGYIVSENLNDETILSNNSSPGVTKLALHLHGNRNNSKIRLGRFYSHVTRFFSNCRIFEFIPEVISKPTAMTGVLNSVLSREGFGLALMLQEILGDDRKSFEKLESEFLQQFPVFSSIKIKKAVGFANPFESQLHKTKLPGFKVFLELQNGYDLSLSQASDGAKIFLALLTLKFSKLCPRIILIEDIENYLHHSLLQTIHDLIVALTRDKSVQILFTTHSPYLLDYFEPDQVLVCTRDSESGTEVFSLDKSEIVKKRSSVFQIGEIWSSESEENLKPDVVSDSGKR